MFVIIKKKTVIICSAILAFIIFATGISVAIGVAASKNRVPQRGITVVIDAGHGGRDGGVVGVSGKIEAELNLAVSQKLALEFESCGINVVMTRNSDNGLYGLSNKNRKTKDMQARSKIINAAKPNLVISVHMNSYPSSDERGAQVFYKKESGEGKVFAETVQAYLKSHLKTQREAKSGDYYILNCSDYPSIIVECGFVSNAEEEKLLASAAYQEKLAYNIFIGAIQYLNILPHEQSIERR